MTDEGDINKLLGIEITHHDEKIYKVSQPFLIDKTISILNIDTKIMVWTPTPNQHRLVSHYYTNTYREN